MSQLPKQLLEVCRAKPRGEEGTYRLLLRPDPFSSAVEIRDIKAGASLAVTIACLNIPDRWRCSLQVSILCDNVPFQAWPRVRPKAGTFVSVIARPMFGGGNGWLRVLGTIAIVVAAAAVAIYAPYLLPAGIGLTAAGTATTTGLIVGALAGAAVSTIGFLALNAFVPPETAKLSSQQDLGSSSLYSIDGGSNENRKWGVIPRNYGKRRVYPLYAAKGYTELVGDDYWYRFLFTVGYGPQLLSDFKVGDTSLDEFECQIEVREGWSTDAPLTLYTSNPTEESLNIDMNEGDSFVRTAPDGTDEVGLILTFPQGVYAVSQSTGDVSSSQIAVRVDVAPTGSDAWVELFTIAYDGKNKQPFRLGSTRALSDVGFSSATRMDVRVVCTRKAQGKLQHVNSITASVLRCTSWEYPVKETGLALIALRIKATDQLSGTLSTFSCIASSVLPDYDSASDDWVVRETANPASIVRDIWTGSANERPLAISRVDDAGLKRLAVFCAAHGRSCHAYVDSETSVDAAVRDIATVARSAVPVPVNGLWTVLPDDPNDQPCWLVTPRSTTGFSWTRTPVEDAHCYRCRFTNEQKDWTQDEMLVFNDGYSVDGSNGTTIATRYEDYETSYVTHPDQVYRDARYMMAQARLRSIDFTIDMDWESLRLVKGDRFYFQHDSILIGGGAGRVTSLALNADGTTASVTLDDFVFFTDAQQACYHRRATGEIAYYTLSNRNQENVQLLEFSPAMPAGKAPEQGDVFVVGPAAREILDLRVKAITPKDDFAATIEAVATAPEMWQAETGPVPAWESPVTVPPSLTPPAPIVDTIVTNEDALTVAADGTLVVRILLRLRTRPIGAEVEVQLWLDAQADTTPSYRRASVLDDGFNVWVGDVEETSTYRVRLRFKTAIGGVGPWTDLGDIYVIGKTTPPRQVTGLAATVELSGVTLTWDANTERDIAEYLVRRRSFGAPYDEVDAGTPIDVARVRTTRYALGPLTIPRDPLALPDGQPGSYAYEVLAVDTGGRLSLTPATVTVVVQTPKVPQVTNSVVDNFVYLSYPTEAGSFALDRWRVRRGAAYVGAQTLVTTAGSFHPVFEAVAGTYTYWIEGIDVAGNVGLPAKQVTEVTVSPNFDVLEVWDLDFAGAVITNGVVRNGKVLLPIDTTETFEEHFTRRNWLSARDQVDATYPLYIQPTPAGARIVQELNYGTVIASTTLAVQPSHEVVAGQVTAAPQIYARADDGDDEAGWEDLGQGWTVVLPKFKRVRLVVDFTADDDKSLALVDYTVVLSVRYVSDAGSVEADAADVDGTPVLFNRAFVDAEEPQVTPKGSAPRLATYAFNDEPYPTGFSVYLWDKDGNRVSGTVSWSIRGIV